MTIRSTACAVALIAGTMLSACELERTSQTSDTGPIEAVEPAPQAGDEAVASTGFGVHVGSYEPGEDFSETWDGGPRSVYFDPEPFITGVHVAEFTDEEDQDGNPALLLQFTEAGAELMRASTSERIGQPMVLTIDGRVHMAPTVQSALSQAAMVTGQGDTEWIDRLATILSEAGAERVERLTINDPVDPELGLMILIASPEQTGPFRFEFPFLEDPNVYFDDQPLLTADHFAGATITTDQAGNPALELELNDEGKAIMEARDEDYVGNYLITTWQGRAISASRVMRQLDDTILVSNAGIDPDLAENWMAALDASLPE
jgi:preprotein translocase subunit SecD